MNGRLRELARRRDALVGRAAEQRGALVAQGAIVARRGRVVDRALSIAALLKAHPAAFAAGIVGSVLLLRRRGARWVGHGWMLWRAWQRLRSQPSSR
jgi:hypothetical protein